MASGGRGRGAAARVDRVTCVMHPGPWRVGRRGEIGVTQLEATRRSRRGPRRPLGRRHGPTLVLAIVAMCASGCLANYDWLQFGGSSSHAGNNKIESAITLREA